MISTDDKSLITFTGKDAGRFLHNQLTADILGLVPGGNDSTFASLCQPKGRVIALLLVQATEDGFNVVCDSSLSEGLLSYLLRFRFRDKVDMAIQADTTVVFPGSGAGSGTNPGIDSDIDLSIDTDIKTDATSGIESVIAPLEAIRYAIVDNDKAPALDPPRVAQLRAWELSQGIVWLNRDTTEQFLPQMLGQERIGALNFQKGCFPGQEIIARTHYLGKLKRHPWTGRVDATLPVPAMSAVSLKGEGVEASAVLVAGSPLTDGTQQVFLVARRAEPFAVNAIEVTTESDEIVSLSAEGQWLTTGVDGGASAG